MSNENSTICFIPDCGKPGTIAITDATQYNGKYNGRLMCQECWDRRKYMQGNDEVS